MFSSVTHSKKTVCSPYTVSQVLCSHLHRCPILPRVTPILGVLNISQWLTANVACLFTSASIKSAICVQKTPKNNAEHREQSAGVVPLQDTRGRLPNSDSAAGQLPGSGLPLWRACTPSPWVTRTVALGYRLQFSRFILIVYTLENNKGFERGKRCNSGVVEARKGWYGCYFVIPKKGGRLMSLEETPSNVQVQNVDRQLTLEIGLQQLTDRCLFSCGNTSRPQTVYEVCV